LSLRIFPESQPSSAFSKFFVTKCGSDSYFKSKCRGRWGSLIRSYRPPPRTNLRTTSRMRQLIKLLRSHQSRLTLNPTSSQFSYHTRPRNMSFETTGTIASFGGKLLKLKHKSSSTNTDMELNLFMPPQAHVPETTAQKRASSSMAQQSTALPLCIQTHRQVRHLHSACRAID
jgi:hypothetical protein